MRPVAQHLLPVAAVAPLGQRNGQRPDVGRADPPRSDVMADRVAFQLSLAHTPDERAQLRNQPEHHHEHDDGGTLSNEHRPPSLGSARRSSSPLVSRVGAASSAMRHASSRCRFIRSTGDRLGACDGAVSTVIAVTGRRDDTPGGQFDLVATRDLRRRASRILRPPQFDRRPSWEAQAMPLLWGAARPPTDRAPDARTRALNLRVDSKPAWL